MVANSDNLGDTVIAYRNGLKRREESMHAHHYTVRGGSTVYRTNILEHVKVTSDEVAICMNCPLPDCPPKSCKRFIEERKRLEIDGRKSRREIVK